MTKANSNKNNTNNGGRRTTRPPRQGSILPNKTNNKIIYSSSRFTNVLDPVVLNTYASPSVMSTISSDPDGTGHVHVILTARGLNAYSTATSTQVAIDASRLPWLATTSRNFGSYRITRANLILVGNVGSTVPGKFTVKTSRDYEDKGTAFSVASTAGNVYDIASLANRNKSIPLRINTDWKKVTDITTASSIAGVVAVVNSANDLTIGTYQIVLVGATPSIPIMDMYIDYDVEFANPMSVGYNV